MAELMGRRFRRTVAAGLRRCACGGQEQGQGMVEYVLVLLFVSIVLIVALQALEGDMTAAIGKVSAALNP